MHPIQDLFLERFSYVLQFDMHFICTPMWTKKIILVKSGCYNFQDEVYKDSDIFFSKQRGKCP
jgi:hypothetical protein